jgi:hypothetical protein
MKNKTEIKQEAQKELLEAMQVAFNNIEASSAIYEEADKQMRRVEKMFGYVEGSWGRGV